MNFYDDYDDLVCTTCGRVVGFLRIIVHILLLCRHL